MEKYIELHLPESFAASVQQKIKPLIEQGQSFTLIGMPAVGTSPFLKFICTWNYAKFIHIDVYDLAEFSLEKFLSLLWLKLTGDTKEVVTFQECKEVLLTKLQSSKRIVIVINKFDLLHKEFSESFFAHFRTITHGTEGKLSFIFSVIKPYIEYSPKAIAGTNMHVFSRYVYFPPYNENDLYALMKLHSPELLGNSRLKNAVVLSGQHIQLLQLILRSDTPNNLLHDPYIKVLFEEITHALSTERQKTLRKIAEGKIGEDHFLEHIGLVVTKQTYEIFSPLFAEYLREKKTHRLSKKERLLFQLLKNNQGKILPKRKLFEAVWPDEFENTTDWALDSLIYRLRRHPAIKEKGYEIVSHKKLGYQLIRES